jgi:chaperonin GroEL
MTILVYSKLMSENLEMNLENVSMGDLGRGKCIFVSNENMTIVEGNDSQEAIWSRINQNCHKIDESTSGYRRGKFHERLAKLPRGDAVIRVRVMAETD